MVVVTEVLLRIDTFSSNATAKARIPCGADDAAAAWALQFPPAASGPRRRDPSNAAGNGSGRRDGGVRPSRSDPHDGGSRTPGGDGTRQAEHQQGEQRPGGGREDLRRVRGTRKPGRHHATDDAEPDQTDCDSHPDNPPDRDTASGMPRCRVQSIQVDVREMPTVVTLRVDRRTRRSSNLYRVTLTGTVAVGTGRPLPPSL